MMSVEGRQSARSGNHPNQQYGTAFVYELNSSIDVWELKDPKGNIECVQTLDMMPPDLAACWRRIFITPDGRHLRLRTASIITVFSVFGRW